MVRGWSWTVRAKFEHFRFVSICGVVLGCILNQLVLISCTI